MYTLHYKFNPVPVFFNGNDDLVLEVNLIS